SKKVEVDVRLDEIVLRALEKEPALRYQQASHVRTDVESFAAGVERQPPVATQQKNMNARSDKTLKTLSQRFWTALPLGIVAGLAAAFLSWLFFRSESRPALQPPAAADASQLSQEGWE